MTGPATRIILYNVAAAAVTIAAVVGAVRSFVVVPTAAPCSERYAGGTFFPLERGGVLLTATDLQERLGGRDVGLGANVEIARIKGGPSPVAIGVTLAKGSASPHAHGLASGGISFPWEPRSVQGKTAACLAYSVMLPPDFDFHRGGTLPGIQGAEAHGQPHDSFSSHLVWRRKGGSVTNRATIGGELRAGSAEAEPFALPVGRWVRLEQEVVLNAPRQSDGVLRVWVDGRLVVDRGNMVYRGRPDVAVTGVGVSVFYGGEDAAGAAPKNATIWLSPFEIRWQ